MKQIIMTSFDISSVLSEYAKNTLPYIDPSTGGLLYQALAAIFGLFSALFLIFSRQIRMAFARSRRFVRDLFKGRALDAKVVQVPTHDSED